MRDSIASLAPGDDPSRWLVRPTPVAFELAVVSDLEMARVGVAQAQERGISAYILGEDAADGPAYRVFAGAYRGPGETAAMRELLDTAGFADAVLRPRVGRVVR